MNNPQLIPARISTEPLPQLPKKIFLVRHGQSAWNKTKRVSGQLNPPLADVGQRQARCLAQVMDGESLTAIYASSLSRAVETALPTARHHELPITQCDELREQHLGILQGRYRDQRDPQAETLWKRRAADRLGFRIPGGESCAELDQRVRRFVHEILPGEAGGTVLIVGHRNSNRLLLAALMGWPLEEAAEIRLRSKYLYEIVPGDEAEICTISLRERDLGDSRQGFRV